MVQLVENVKEDDLTRPDQTRPQTADRRLDTKEKKKRKKNEKGSHAPFLPSLVFFPSGLSLLLPSSFLRLFSLVSQSVFPLLSSVFSSPLFSSPLFSSPQCFATFFFSCFFFFFLSLHPTLHPSSRLAHHLHHHHPLFLPSLFSHTLSPSLSRPSILPLPASMTIQ